MFCDFLPEPQETKYLPGTCDFTRLKHGFSSHLNAACRELLNKELPGPRPRPRHAALPSLVLTADTRPPANLRPDFKPLPAAVPEAYYLAVSPDRIEIHANEPVGVWRGVQTLLLLLQDNPGQVPCCQIRDWPAIRWRGIHVDLKGYQPTFARLRELLRLLARYKINAVLLELEDKFAYTGAPEIGIATAYTPAQLRELGKYAATLGIELIPKIQCLAHVDYILKHKRYASLRENGHPFQFCPRHPGANELWRQMAGEVMDCLPGTNFFHVGADESANLGECPVCRPGGKGAAYLHIVGRALEFVASHGRQAIMWDDILRNLHGHLDGRDLAKVQALGRRALMMYWAYGYGGEHDNTFSCLPDYRRRKFQVWGASGFCGCGPRWFQNVPDLRGRAWNIAAWTKTAVEGGLAGVMTTGWTRITSFEPPAEIPEACWFQILYAADSLWRGRSRPLEQFCQVAARSFYGVELPEHTAYLLDLDPRLRPAVPGRFSSPRQPERLALLNAAIASAGNEALRTTAPLSVYELRHAYHGLLGDKIADYRRGLFHDRARALADSAAENAAAMREILGRFYEEPTVAEFIRSRFAHDAECAADLRRLADASQLL